ncbi:hypothetical protein JMN23_13045 [Bacillus sp. RHFB]|nr:hypothetical protein [Bacillus sp. RHFB]
MQDIENYYFNEEICDNPADSWQVKNPLHAFWRKGSNFWEHLKTVGKLAFFEFATV